MIELQKLFLILLAHIYLTIGEVMANLGALIRSWGLNLIAHADRYALHSNRL